MDRVLKAAALTDPEASSQMLKSSASCNIDFLAHALERDARCSSLEILPKDVVYLSDLCTSVRPLEHLTITRKSLGWNEARRITRSCAFHTTSQISQASAKVSCLYGIPSAESLEEVLDLNPSKLRSHARAKIYNIQQYSMNNRWGPFQSDYSNDADWEKLQAIAILVVLNVSSLEWNDSQGTAIIDRWNVPFSGVIPGSFRSPRPYTHCEDPSVFDKDDPYGITGTWDRIVCFLDYTDFYHFNFKDGRIPQPEPRAPVEAEEAVIAIRMKLRVTKIEAPAKEDRQDLPVVHFRGSSALLPPHGDPTTGSAIRG